MRWCLFSTPPETHHQGIFDEALAAGVRQKSQIQWSLQRKLRLLRWSWRTSLLRRQREGPNRTSRWHLAGCIPRCHGAAKTGSNGHILAALVRVGNGRRIYARYGLELPQRLAGVLVQRNELTRQFAGEHQPSA